MAFFPFTQLDDNVSDAGDLVSVEVFRAIADNCNYLIDSMPIGSIIPVMVGFAGCPTPDPLLWQLCDGSTVTNQDSELRNNPTPTYSEVGGRYMRGYIGVGTIGFYGGSNTKDLTHDHNGTNNFNPDLKADSDDDFLTATSHKHEINVDLSTNHNFEPIHFRVQHYIKIA